MFETNWMHSSQPASQLVPCRIRAVASICTYTHDNDVNFVQLYNWIDFNPAILILHITISYPINVHRKCIAKLVSILLKTKAFWPHSNNKNSTKNPIFDIGWLVEVMFVLYWNFIVRKYFRIWSNFNWIPFVVVDLMLKECIRIHSMDFIKEFWFYSKVINAFSWSYFEWKVCVLQFASVTWSNISKTNNQAMVSVSFSNVCLLQYKNKCCCFRIHALKWAEHCHQPLNP